MATTLPPDLLGEDPGVYRSLSMGGRLAQRLEQMLPEGRVLVARNRYRWQRNREAYRGNTYLQPLSLAKGQGQLHRLAPAEMLPSGRRRDSINRLRQFVDGRNSLLTSDKPTHEAIPASRESRDRDAARVATRLVDFQWDNVDGWNIAAYAYDVSLYAEQDGLAFGNVTYDRSQGEVCIEVTAPDPQTGQLRPVTERDELEALQESDPQGGTLWQPNIYPSGEVVLRAVRASALAFDPNMTTDWRGCSWIIESRRRKTVDIERQIGKPVADLIKQSNAALGRKTQGQARRSSGTVLPDDGSGEQNLDPQREVMVHELFHRATGETGEFPDGAHVLWIQDAAATPLVVEKWLWPNGKPRGLPYRPYIPRPDGGHILNTLGTVDELLPVQRQFDRRLSQYGEWLDLAARPLFVMVGGSLRSKSVYNADRVVYVHPGFEKPYFMTVPPDPGIALLQVLGFLQEQMGEIAVQSGAVRGQAPPGVEAAAAFNTLVVQGENQLAGTENQWQQFVQWSVSEALRNVEWFYSIERTIAMPGVEDEADFKNFTGAKIKGASTWRIKGSVLPKNRAAQVQMLTQFMQYAGPRFDPTPFAAEILEGDVDAIISMERAQGRKQETENLDLAALANLPDRDRVWQTFTLMRDRYVAAYAALSQQLTKASQATGVAPAMSPQQVMQQLGPPPPRVLDILGKAGLKVPRVAVTDRDHMHIRSLELFMTNDSFRSQHELVQQACLEHLNEHVEQASRRAAAIAMQSPQMPTPGAQPAEAPSPPPGEQE